MRSFPRLSSLVLVALFLVACGQQPDVFAPQDEATLRGMFDSTVTNIRAGDWATWSAQYTETAVLQPPNAPTVTGRPAILAWGQAFPPVESLAFSEVQVSGEGNLAYGTSAYALKIKDLPQDNGKQLVVFRRSPGAKWEVVAVSFSSDLPMPAPAPSSPPTSK